MIPFELHRRLPLLRRPFYQRDRVIAERDAVIAERNAAIAERDEAIMARNEALQLVFGAETERDMARAEISAQLQKPATPPILEPQKWEIPRDTAWNGGLYEIKDKAAGAPGQKIMLIGGSATHFGFRAEAISNALGRNVVNYGVHAGFPVQYHLDRVQKYLRPGDTAVLTFEWHCIQHPDYFTETFARQVGFNDLEYALRLDPSQTRKVLASMLEGRLAELRSKHAAIWDGPLYKWATVTPWGDETSNEPEAVTDAMREAVAAVPPIELIPIAGNAAFEPIARFAEYARSKGIKVLAAFPPMVRHPTYDTEGHAAIFESAVEAYTAAGVPCLGRPEDYLLDHAEMFDTGYHANKNGNERLTQDLIARLRKAGF